jgi:hypothetical protein
MDSYIINDAEADFAIRFGRTERYETRANIGTIRVTKGY